ncbi:MAG: (d)CMP kinase, partial [Caldisericaceae bacterium]
VGRDIGTVVLSDATLKVYLTATDEERAARRFKELISKGVNVTYEEVLANIKERDLIDSSRTNSPLLVAKDAYVIDTTNLAVDEVVTSILQFLEGKLYAIRNSSHHS